MLWLTVLILVLLVAINYAIGGRAVIYPAFVFCLVWAVDLLLILLSGDFFYRMSEETLLIFSLGALIFSIGGALALLVPMKTHKPEEIGKSRNRLLTILFWLFVLGLPLAYRYVASKAEGYGTLNMVAAAYKNGLEENTAGSDAGYSLFGNYITFGLFFGLIAFQEREKGPKRAVAAILLALVMNLLTGGRVAFVTVVFGVLSIDWFRTRRIRWKLLLSMGLAFVVLMVGVAIAVGKGGANPDASLAENAAPVADGLLMYAAGGLVGFDRVVQNPGIIVHNWNPNRAFLMVFNKLGGDFEIPSLHADFLTVGPHMLIDNVYTFYFAYIDLGYVGMMAIILGLGFCITLLYKKAMQGHPPSIIVYSTFVGGILMTVFNESLLTALIFPVRLWLACWLFYSFPAVWLRFKRFVGRASATIVTGYQQIDGQSFGAAE